jgi:hypothetical protein
VLLPVVGEVGDQPSFAFLKIYGESQPVKRRKLDKRVIRRLSTCLSLLD